MCILVAVFVRSPTSGISALITVQLINLVLALIVPHTKTWMSIIPVQSKSIFISPADRDSRKSNKKSSRSKDYCSNIQEIPFKFFKNSKVEISKIIHRSCYNFQTTHFGNQFLPNSSNVHKRLFKISTLEPLKLCRYLSS